MTVPIIGVRNSHSLARIQIWEAVQPDLLTDDSCTAGYRGIPFTTSAGTCSASSLAGAVIK